METIEIGKPSAGVATGDLGHSDAALLEITDLTVGFATEHGAVAAADRVSFQLHKGKVLGIIGESGSGKSTVLYTIAGLLPKKTAKVHADALRFLGSDLLALGEKNYRRLRGAHISMVFQDPMSSLNPLLRIGEQIMEIVRAHGRLPRRQAKQRALDLIRDVELPDPERIFQSFPHQLSGGMRQRVVIAIAIALGPELLLADEPTTALDPTIQRQILDLLLAITARNNTAMILVSHDVGVVRTVSDRVAVMYGGRIVEIGPAESVLATPAHPYTAALRECQPSRNNPGTDLPHIAGAPSVRSTGAIGCPFAPRCDRALPACTSTTPEMQPVPAGTNVVQTKPERDDATHGVACLNPLMPLQSPASPMEIGHGEVDHV